MTAHTPTRAIKGFDRNLVCRGYQFEIGKSYTVKGKIKACKNGFHSCPVDDDTPPHAVFGYYAPGTSRYCEVEVCGETEREGSKIASASITIGVELTMNELMARVARWCEAKAKGAASNSGYRGAASNSGTYGAASNSGTYGAASNSGDCGAASNSGAYGAASNSGDCGAASNSGSCGAASNSGAYGAASNSGDCGAASNSGAYGAASNSGSCGAAFSHAYGGKVMCEGDGQALYCSEISANGKLLSTACGTTGQDGIRAGVWYQAKGGELVEVST